MDYNLGNAMFNTGLEVLMEKVALRAGFKAMDRAHQERLRQQADQSRRIGAPEIQNIPTDEEFNKTVKGILNEPQRGGAHSISDIWQDRAKWMKQDAAPQPAPFVPSREDFAAQLKQVRARGDVQAEEALKKQYLQSRQDIRPAEPGRRGTKLETTMSPTEVAQGGKTFGHLGGGGEGIADQVLNPDHGVAVRRIEAEKGMTTTSGKPIKSGLSSPEMQMRKERFADAAKGNDALVGTHATMNVPRGDGRMYINEFVGGRGGKAEPQGADAVPSQRRTFDDMQGIGKQVGLESVQDISEGRNMGWDPRKGRHRAFDFVPGEKGEFVPRDFAGNDAEGKPIVRDGKVAPAHSLVQGPGARAPMGHSEGFSGDALSSDEHFALRDSVFGKDAPNPYKLKRTKEERQQRANVKANQARDDRAALLAEGRAPANRSEARRMAKARVEATQQQPLPPTPARVRAAVDRFSPTERQVDPARENKRQEQLRARQTSVDSALRSQGRAVPETAAPTAKQQAVIQGRLDAQARAEVQATPKPTTGAQRAVQQFGVQPSPDIHTQLARGSSEGTPRGLPIAQGDVDKAVGRLGVRPPPPPPAAFAVKTPAAQRPAAAAATPPRPIARPITRARIA